MTKINHSLEKDQNILDALKHLPKFMYDNKHHLLLCLNDNNARSNETRFEHIAKKYHELKVRDIEAIPDGINHYVKYSKSKTLKDTYSYFIKRKGNDQGFIKVDILIDINDKNKAYIKSIYISYRLK